MDITQISNGTGATVTAEFPDSVEVTFTPDGHRSVFSRAWLAASALPDAGVGADADLRTEDGKVLWRAASLGRRPGRELGGLPGRGAARVRVAGGGAARARDAGRRAT